jgi:hypothetical protein
VPTTTHTSFAALSRIRQYQLDKWLPGKHAMVRLGNTQYTRVSAGIVDRLVRSGYETHDGYAHPDSSEVEVDGLHFCIETDDWGCAQDATQVRGIIRSGLVHLSKTNRPRLDRLYENTVAGVQDTLLTTIIISAVTVVTAKYGTEFARFEHAISVRALEGASVSS